MTNQVRGNPYSGAGSLYSEKPVYADYAATAPMPEEVFAAMEPYLREAERSGNPSALHRFGIEAEKTLRKTREEIADLLGAAPEEILFTSGGTESDNLALSGSLLAGQGINDRREILLSGLEHPAVRECCRFWAGRGYTLLSVPVSRDGRADSAALDSLVSDRTALVCLMAANNETGVLQPVDGAVASAHRVGAPLLCDAVQAAPWLPVGGKALGGADFVSLSGHKLGALRGTGLLYVRQGALLSPLLFGGGQERGLRSGTENVAGAVALLAALRRAERLRADGERVRQLGFRLRMGLSAIPDAHFHSTDAGIPGLVNVSFDCVEGMPLASLLSRLGVFASPGAACSARERKPSAVLLAMGCSETEAMGAIRFSLSHENTEGDVSRILHATAEAVHSLRSLDLAGSKKY